MNRPYFPLTLLAILAALVPLSAAPKPIPPEAVAVVYNDAEPKSRELAQHYAKARKIPAGNLIGLKTTTGGTVSRADFEKTIRQPLIATFNKKEWWTLGKDGAGVALPTASRIRVIVCMCGVPYRIARTLESVPENDRKRKHYRPSAEGDEASVDSELALLGLESYLLKGPLKNLYYDLDLSIMERKGLPFVVGRIDGPGYPLCKRLIDDAVATEKAGLWGMCYLDLARKGDAYAVGDQWLEAVAKANGKAGIPTAVDRNADTFVTNYPMTDAALYYGWYTTHRDGPFLNPGFKFRRGAVAVHLHSFSAADLRNASKRWCGPLLDRGAAGTLGNVYEPFLTLTHHFDVFHDRLLKGYTLGEAAYMASPGLSWQAVVIGDPLYRPFPDLTTVDIAGEDDKDFKALRTGFARWHGDPETLVTKVRTAAAKMNSGRLYEALGLRAAALREPEQAAAFFASAGDKYLRDADKLRQILHLVELDRQSGRKQEAVTRLRKAQPRYAAIPEAKSITALLNILDPPAPPPVKVEPK